MRVEDAAERRLSTPSLGITDGAVLSLDGEKFYGLLSTPSLGITITRNLRSAKSPALCEGLSTPSLGITNVGSQNER